MTISDFLTTCAGRLRAAVSNRRAPLRGKGAENPGITARIAAAGLFALAATVMLPASDAQAQQAGAGHSNSSFTFHGNDTTVPEGGTVSFDAVLVYGQRTEDKFVGANVVITSGDGLDTEVNTVVADNTTRTIVTNEFTISLNASTDSRIFLVTDRSNTGGRSGSFRIMFPDTVYRLASTATAQVDITPRTDAERSVDENRDAVRIGAATFTAGDAFRLDDVFTGPGVPAPAEGGAFRVRANVNPSAVTYTIADPSATVARTSSNTIPAATGESRTFTVALDNISPTVTAENDVRRVRLTLDILGTGIDSNSITLNEDPANGVTSEECDGDGSECGWLVDRQYTIYQDVLDTPYISFIGGNENRILLDVPVPAGGFPDNATRTVTFTLNTITTVPTATQTLTPTITGLALRTEDGNTELRDVSLTGIPSTDLSTTFTFRAANTNTDATLDPSLVTIGGETITLVEGNTPTNSTGTVSIPGSLTEDSRFAEVSVATLNDDATVTSISFARTIAPTNIVVPTEDASGAFTQRLTGLVPGTYIVTINTEAADESTERSYDITLTVEGASIALGETTELLEDGAAGAFTVSLAGIDTSESVTGVEIILEVATDPVGDLGDFAEDANVAGGLTWQNNLFALTFPDTATNIAASGGGDRITFIATLPEDGGVTLGTLEVPIMIAALSGNSALRGDYDVSIVSVARVAGTDQVGDFLTARPDTTAPFTVSAPAPSTVSISVAGDATTIPETAGILDITVSLNVPATEQITLPITFGGGVNDATLLESGNGSGPFVPSDADYAVYSDECSGTDSDEAGSRYCATGHDLVFNVDDQDKTLTVRARADGTDSNDVDETITITLDATGLTSSRLTADGDAFVTLDIIPPSFRFDSPKNRRLEIGGAAGEITLQIEDFHFPNDADTNAFLGVTINLGNIITPDGGSPSQFFPRTSDDDRNMTVDQGQDIEGDTLRISLPNPDNLTGDNRPFIFSRGASTFLLLVPRVLFVENGTTGRSLGTESGIGDEDIVLNVRAIDKDSALTGDFVWSLGSDSNVYNTHAEGKVTFAQRVGLGLGTFAPNASAEDVEFSITRASDANPLPRTMNPATQDVLKSSRPNDAQNGGVITIALPGITAPPNAVKGEIVLDVNSKTTVDDVTVGGSSSTGRGSVRLGDTDSGRVFNLRVPGVSGSRHTTLGFPAGNVAAGNVQDISLSFVATPRQMIRGDVTLRVIPSAGLKDPVGEIPATEQAVIDGDNVTFTASGVIFRNSADKVIDADGEEVTAFEVPLPASALENDNNVAEVKAVSIGARTSILDGLRLDGGFDVFNRNIIGGVVFRGVSEPSLLSEPDDTTGTGLAEMRFVASDEDIRVDMTLDDSGSAIGDPPGPTSGDTITFTGTSALPTALTVSAPTTDDDSRNNIDIHYTVSGFTSGTNILTIAVAGSDATRTYTIRVIVPPEPPGENDFTLSSVTVNGLPEVTTDFGTNPATPGVVSVPGVLPLIETVNIVATSRNADADVTVCTVTDPVTRIGLPVTDTTMAPIPNVNDDTSRDEDRVIPFRILVAAVAAPASLPCSTATAAVGNDNLVEEYFLTVTVEAVPNDATIDIAATTLDPDGAPVEVPVGDITYSLTAGAGTATADIVLPAGTTAGGLTITAAANGARVTSIGGTDLVTPATNNITTAALTGIANEGTLTFTVTAENDDTEIVYTLTYIVQDALLTSATFTSTADVESTFTQTSDPSVNCVAPIALVGCTGRITGIAADTGSGTLTLVLADTDDTINDVTGVTEAGGELGVSQVGTTNNYTVDGLLAPGTSTLTVVVRPDNTDGDEDRTYEIELLVTNPSTTPEAGIEPIGRTVVAPGEEAEFNVFLTGFNTIHRSVGSQTVRNAQMRLSFSPPAGEGDVAFTRTGRTFVNTYYSVELPPETLGEFFNLDDDGGNVDNQISFWVGNQIEDTTFTDDGIIYLPIGITAHDYDDDNNPGTPDVFAPMVTIEFVGDVEGLDASSNVVERAANTAIDPSSLTYTVTERERSSARVSTDAVSINAGASTQIRVNVDPGFGTLESSGYAEVDFTVAGDPGIGRTVSVAAGSGETVSSVNVNADGGSFRIDDGDGDAIITVTPLATSAAGPLTLTLTGLEYESYEGDDDPANAPTAGPITANPGFDSDDDTAAVISVVAKGDTTLRAPTMDTTGLSVGIASGANQFDAVSVDGYVGANTTPVDVFLPGNVADTDRVDFVITATQDDTTTGDSGTGAYILVCEGDSSSGTALRGTGTVGVSGFTPTTAKTVNIHITSGNRVGGGFSTCSVAEGDSFTDTYVFNVLVAPVPTGTINQATPLNLVENGGTTGTFTVELTDILGVFDHDSSPATDRVDFTNFSVNLALVVTGANADDGFTTLTNPNATVETDDFSLAVGGGAMFNTRANADEFSLSVPHSAFTFDDNGFGDASVEITITTKDITDADLSYTMDFTVVSALHRADLSAISDFVEGTNTAPIFTVIAGNVPVASLSREGDENLPQSAADGTGKNFFIDVSNIPVMGQPDAGDLVIPYTLTSRAVGTVAAAQYGDTVTADGSEDYIITTATGSGIAVSTPTGNPLTGTITVLETNLATVLTEPVVNHLHAGRLTVFIDPTNDPFEDEDEIVILELTGAGGGTIMPDNLIPNNLSEGMRTVKITEQASARLTAAATNVDEGDSTDVTVRIGRGPLIGGPAAAVNFSLGGTATPGVDYSVTLNSTATPNVSGFSTSGNTGSFTINQGAANVEAVLTVAAATEPGTSQSDIDPAETIVITITSVEFSDPASTRVSVLPAPVSIVINNLNAGASISAPTERSIREKVSTVPAIPNSATFEVVISSAPTSNPAVIVVSFAGSSATFAGASTADGDGDYSVTAAPASGAPAIVGGAIMYDTDLGTMTLTTGVTAGAAVGARIIYTITATDDTDNGEPNEEIRITLDSVAEGENMFVLSSEALPITLIDDDVVVRASLSGDISIGEKAQGEGTITLNLADRSPDFGVATVTFSISNPAGDPDATPDPIPTLIPTPPDEADYTLAIEHSANTDVPLGTIRATGNTFELPPNVSSARFIFTAIDDDRREGNEKVEIEITRLMFNMHPILGNVSGAAANVTITEVSGEDVMRETQMITHVVGKEQVNLVTGLVRQRVSALTLGSPQGFSEPGVQLALAENPETIQDFFSQMALESSGEMDDGGAFAIWAKGQYIKISGSPDVAGQDNFEYDGKIAGIGMGMEKRFKESLVGLSMNFSTADIDSKSDMRAEGNYKETMTFFAPYAAWKPDNSRLTLWGTAGAGFGSAEITGGEDHGEGNPSVQAFFAQGGVDISDNIGKTAEVVFGMSAVAIEKTVDAWTAGALSVPEASSSVFQAQADFTAYFPVYSDDGQVLRPYVGLASVHDVGDVTNDDRHAMELQTGIAWSNGPWQVSFDTFYQFLRDDEEAWGVFGEAQWSGRGDLDGLLMGVTSGHGTASSMSDAASSTDSVNSDINTNLADADTETAEWSIQTTTEYGFAAPVMDRNGRAAPFFRSTHSADARSFVSGVRMDVTDNVGVTAESSRHIPADDDPYSEHAVGLEARWEF